MALELLDHQFKTTQQREQVFKEQFLKKVHNTKTDEHIYEYSPKQKKLFHQTFSGMQAGKAKGEKLIFWTLTTRYEKNQKQNALLLADEELNNHFQIWKKRICRYIQHERFNRWFHENYPETDLSTRKGRKHYREIKNHPYKTHGPKNDPAGIWRPWYYNFRYKMCYIKVRTAEGGGVIHGILRKSPSVPMLEFHFLQRAWKQIHHNSHRVEIHEIHDREEGLAGAKDTAYYLCGNYFNQQPVVRRSASYNWIFQGALTAWTKGKTILHPKKRKIETIPFTYENPQTKKDECYTWKTNKPYKLWQRKSITRYFMDTRKSLRHDSGYENALFHWLKLTRHPPTPTRQLHIHEHKWQITAAQQETEHTYTLFKRCTECRKWAIKTKIFKIDTF